VITRSLHLHYVLGLATAALALAAAPSAKAQGGTAPTTAPTTAAPTTGSTTPTTTEDEEAKKKKAEADAAAASANAPGSSAPSTGAAPAATATTGTTVTFGAGSGTKKDEPSKDAKAAAADTAVQPFRGSLLIIDQSMTTNTFSKGSQLSYQPLYEWWISPRVAYNFSKQVRFTLRQDLFKEWTNTSETTYAREWRYTDTWLTLAYRPDLTSVSKHLSGGLGFILRPGISKESRIASQYFSAGPSANIGYAFDLGGEKAKAFKSLNVSAAVNYQHSFSKCNTPCAADSSEFGQARMNARNEAVRDQQVRSASMVGNQLLYSLNLGVDIVEHLDFSASMIWISQFAYKTSDAFTKDGTEVGRAPDDTRLRQFSWWFTQVTWGFSKEASLAFGYYNLNAVVGPDGKYRNPFWSPDARVFLDLYVHLDAIYEKLTKGEGKKGTGPAGGGRVF
jgi:hypothetical protein